MLAIDFVDSSLYNYSRLLSRIIHSLFIFCTLHFFAMYLFGKHFVDLLLVLLHRVA